LCRGHILSPTRARSDLPAWLLAFAGTLIKLTPVRFADAEQALRSLENQRIHRAPQSRRRLLLTMLAAVAVLGVVEFARLAWPVPRASPAVAVAPASAPRVTVLPVEVDGGDAKLAQVDRGHGDVRYSYSK